MSSTIKNGSAWKSLEDKQTPNCLYPSKKLCQCGVAEADKKGDVEVPAAASCAKESLTPALPPQLEKAASCQWCVTFGSADFHIPNVVIK